MEAIKLKTVSSRLKEARIKWVDKDRVDFVYINFDSNPTLQKWSPIGKELCFPWYQVIKSHVACDTITGNPVCSFSEQKVPPKNEHITGQARGHIRYAWPDLMPENVLEGCDHRHLIPLISSHNLERKKGVTE